MVASFFVAHGVKALRDPDANVEAAKPVTDQLGPMLEKYAPQLPTDTRSLVRIKGGVDLAAGLMLASGRLPRLSSLILAASLVPTTMARHPFWRAEDPEEKAAQRTEFFKNLAIAGGLLVAGVDTAGRPGLRWRAQHAASGARRSARTARREARLAARVGRAEMTQKARSVLPT